METSGNTVVAVQIENIHGVLRELRENIRELRASAEDSGRWRAGTEEVLDSMLERIDGVSDDVDKLKQTSNAHQSFIDQFRGGKFAVAQLVTQIGTLIGIGVTLYKVLTMK